MPLGVLGLTTVLLTGNPAVSVAAGALPLAVRVGAWRSAVGVSVMASVLRYGELSTLLPEFGWYALQFGPILAAIPASFMRPRAPRRRVDRRLATSLAALSVLALLSTLWSAQPENTAQQAGIFILVTVFLISTTTWRWTDVATVRGDMTFIFTILGAIHSAGVVAGLAGLPSAFGYFGRFQGLFSNPNYAGMSSAVAIALGVFLLAGSSAFIRLVIIGLVGVQSTALIWSGSRGALGTLVVGLVAASVGLAGRRVRPVLVLAGLGAMVAPLVIPFASLTSSVLFTRDDKGVDFTSGRLEIWASLLHQWQEHPVLGTGFRTIEGSTDSGLDAHNIYLSFLVELGTVGILLLAVVVMSALASGARRRPSALLLAPAVVVLTIEITEASCGPCARTARPPPKASTPRFLVTTPRPPVRRINRSAPRRHSRARRVARVRPDNGRTI